MNDNGGKFTDEQLKALVNAAINAVGGDKNGNNILHGIFDKRSPPSQKDLQDAFDKFEKIISNKIKAENANTPTSTNNPQK